MSAGEVLQTLPMPQPPSQGQPSWPRPHLLQVVYKIPRTAANWCSEHWGLLMKIPDSTELFWGICARVVTSHTSSKSTSKERNVMLRTLSWSTQILTSCPWQILEPTQMGPSFLPALPGLRGGWLSLWSSARRKRIRILWKPSSALGPGMTQTAK